MRITRETIRVENELTALLPQLVARLRETLGNYTGPVLLKTGLRPR